MEKQLESAYFEVQQAAREFDYEVNFKRWFKTMLEDCMLTEFEENLVCVPSYERDEKRKNQRNGFYYRSLQTVLGLIEDLKVPRPRTGGFTPGLFEKYERRQKSINKVITECYWRGISTRDVSHVVHELTGVHVASSVVTRLTKKWDEETQAWHKRCLADDYIYLMFDGVWIKNRSMGEKRRLVLVAYGVRADGSREMIDYQLSQSESESNWQKFLTHLSARGLVGKSLKLIVSDGCKGLQNAIDTVYPLIDHQLCWAHKMRNILKHVKTADQSKVHAGLKPLFDASVKTKAAAMNIIWKWQKEWRSQCPKAVKCLDRDLERLLLYFNCPKEHLKAVRTSNHIERQFKELRRRMRSMEVLPNKDCADRTLYALMQIRNEKLKAYPLEITHNYLH
jgi:transposase-like protein